MPLHYASQNGQKEIAEILIRAVPLDAKNSYGRTLFCFAAANAERLNLPAAD